MVKVQRSRVTSRRFLLPQPIDNVDYEKAFDRVDWKNLINALRRIGVD